MSKKLEKLDRLVNKLMTRYGSEDADVKRLKDELGALKAFERFDRWSNEKHWRSTDFQTPGQKIKRQGAIDIQVVSSH